MNHWSSQLALTGWLAVLAGCATAPPLQTEQQPAPVAATWSASTPSASQTAVEADWLSSFGDGVVVTLAAEALDNNYDLQATAARLQIATADASAAGSALYPSASVNSGATRRQANARTFGVVNRTTTNQFSLSLDISWELDVWGRIRDQQSAALADAQAAAADFRGAKLSLTARVADLWFQLQAAESQVQLAEATLESFRRATEVIEQQYLRGLTPALDLRLARSQTETAAARLQQRQRERDGLQRSIEVLLGRYPSAEIATGASLPAIPPVLSAGTPSELLLRRPDLIRAERILAASEVRIDVARKAFLPRFSLTASGGQQSDQLGELMDANWSVWSLAGNLVQPLFQGRQLTANLEAAKARATQALASYGQTALTAFGEVESALAAESFLREQLSSIQRAAVEANESESLAWERYQRGLTTIITVLESQQRAFDANSSVIEVQLALLRNRVALHLALGGSLSEDGAQTLRIRTPMGAYELQETGDTTEWRHHTRPTFEP